MDVSLPANRPIVDYLDEVIGLFQTNVVAPEQQDLIAEKAHMWVLSSPSTGVIAEHDTLANASISDGDQLYLTRREEAAQAPFVDDIMSELRQTIDRSQWTWAGDRRRDGLLTTVIGTMLVATVVILRRVFHAATARMQSGVLSGTADNAISTPVVIVLLTGLTICALTAVVIAAWRPRMWTRWLGFALPVVAGVVGFLGLIPLSGASALAFWISIVALCAIPAVWLASKASTGSGATPQKSTPANRSPLAGILGCLLVAVVSAVFGLAVFSGASPFAITAWGAWVPVLLLLATPTIAIGSTGLAALLRRSDEGQSVARERIRQVSLRTERVSRGLTWFATTLAAAIILTLGSSPYWQHGLIAGILSLVILFRTNGFSDARVIVPLLLVGITGLSLTAGSAVQWTTQTDSTNPETFVSWWLGGSIAVWPSWLTALCVFAFAIAVQLTLVARKPDELAEARWAKIFTIVDTVACIAFIPLVLIGQGVLTYYWTVS